MTYWKSARALVFIVIIPYIIIYYFIDSNNASISKVLKTPIKNTTVTRKPKIYISTYDSFMSIKGQYEDLGAEVRLNYTKITPVCFLNMTTLGPVSFNIYPELTLKLVEDLSTDVKAGGYWSPAHCAPRHRVAILVPYSHRERNLGIFLYHIHPFLKKQLLEYRVFVIEQYGSEGFFNKGILYNAGFLESQRFGRWNCHVFHDVDLLPMNEKILYSCPRKPVHMSSTVFRNTSATHYSHMYGGVTAMIPAHFESVNGYSNYYWNWGGEDDDMFIRLQAKRYPVLRYNTTISRYVHLSHRPNIINSNRFHILNSAKTRFRDEGLRTVTYSVMALEKRKLYTHILIDVNPYNWTISA